MIDLCDADGSLWGGTNMLGLFMRASKDIFSEKQCDTLAGMAVAQVVKSAKKKDDMYNNYLLILSNYAGKESMPYFKAFFEDEWRTPLLVAISGYFRRNLSTLEFDSMMSRKACLLYEAHEAVNGLLSPRMQKTEGAPPVSAE